VRKILPMRLQREKSAAVSTRVPFPGWHIGWKVAARRGTAHAPVLQEAVFRNWRKRLISGPQSEVPNPIFLNCDKGMKTLCQACDGAFRFCYE
jgi:hypothetical protein